MENHSQFLPDQKARKSLAKKLCLKFDESMQDWEYEIADSTRIAEFFEEYDKPETTDKEKESLMEIIIDSTNDIFDQNNNVEIEKYLLLINERLIKSIDLHKGTLNYWKSNDFEISKRLANFEI
tara:strand:- start:416 stop:787 length:372 start_codon:yes stop_codon:yes gene_type:complete